MNADHLHQLEVIHGRALLLRSRALKLGPAAAEIVDALDRDLRALVLDMTAEVDQ